MRKTIYMLCTALSVLCLGACSDDDEVMTEVAPAASGVFTDADGEEYRTVVYGSLEWMAENYRGGEPWVYQSYLTDNGLENWFEDDFYADKELEIISETGNYMNWQQAVDNCPEGWRLPTDEDWQQLEGIMGVNGIGSLGWRDGGGLPMMAEGGIHLTLMGVIHAKFTAYYEKCEVGDFGTYWTATIDKDMAFECAFIRKVMGGKNSVMRHSMPTKRYAMVRYVRDVK